jgi:hypothetical protein
MRDHGLDEVRALLPDVRLDDADPIGGDSGRSMVWRVQAQWPDSAESTVIVKRFADAGEWWMRESAAMAVLPDDAPAARGIAESRHPPLLVMTDVGAGPSVADVLLGTEPEAAAEAVRQWAVAIATTHRTTLGLREGFRAALGQRSGELLLGESRMSLVADQAAHALEDFCSNLDVAVPPHALHELRELPRQLTGDGAAAMSPDDACPDNNVWVDGRLLLVDFEGAQWRHIAWDVAYLSVPWPSCWCSWRMPTDVAERALECYRATLEANLPYVRTAEFRQDVAAAAVGWELISTSWYLGNALGEDPPSEDSGKPTPTRRAMILHRLDGARRSTQLPAAAELAEGLRARLVERWGEVLLASAPAFETG